MKKIVLILIFICVSCTYQLGSVTTKPGSTDRDRDLDLLMCQNAAQNHGGASGAEWIPFAGYSVSKNIRIEEFKNCMEAKGYQVTPPK